MPLLKQVANASSGIPLILFSSDTFWTWTANDVELAWRYAVDKRVIDRITAANPPEPNGIPANIYEATLYLEGDGGRGGLLGQRRGRLTR